LALLSRDPALVVAVDISEAQLACVALKVAAIRDLDHPDFLAFLGFRESPVARSATYTSIRSSIDSDARAFWDRHPELIEAGIIHSGKFEQYFHRFRRFVLPLVHGRRDTAQLLAPKSQSDRETFYEQRWDTWRWRAMFRMFFSEFVMGRMGRDPEFFRYVEGSVSDRILSRVRYALTTLPGERNPFMTYILTGNFGDALPLYAREATYDKIRANLSRLRVVNGTIADANRTLGVKYDACNLSDIFEYMDEPTFRAVADDLLRNCNDCARLAYWNMLVPRSIATLMPDRVVADVADAEELHRVDQAFFYSAFHVDHVSMR
ncbi:MAG: DUF3419 family protein, partial [bacterium]|nr:DUF3419 family protein [Candidatus Kapabacteria bacterium]